MRLEHVTGLKRRTRNALLNGVRLGHTGHWEPVSDVDALAASTVRGLLRLRGLGAKSLFDCEDFLRARGFTSKTSRLLAEIEDEIRR